VESDRSSRLDCLKSWVELCRPKNEMVIDSSSQQLFCSRSCAPARSFAGSLCDLLHRCIPYKARVDRQRIGAAFDGTNYRGAPECANDGFQLSLILHNCPPSATLLLRQSTKSNRSWPRKVIPNTKVRHSPITRSVRVPGSHPQLLQPAASRSITSSISPISRACTLLREDLLHPTLRADEDDTSWRMDPSPLPQQRTPRYVAERISAAADSCLHSIDEINNTGSGSGHGPGIGTPKYSPVRPDCVVCISGFACGKIGLRTTMQTGLV